VGGLPYGVRERDLERFFKGYGRTRDILIKNGYGFVVSTKRFIFNAINTKIRKFKFIYIWVAKFYGFSIEKVFCSNPECKRIATYPFYTIS